MHNPLRSEAEAFRFLVVVIAVAVVVAAAAYLNTWLGVAAAIVAVGGVVTWLLRGPHEPKQATMVVSSTPAGSHRVLLVTPSGATGVAGHISGQATDVLVVVPALVSTMQSLTGAVDDEREEAQRTAEEVAGDLTRGGIPARGVVGADDTVLAIEDALREFGADEIVLAMGDDTLVAKVRERFAVPVSRT
jgi:hypothetical protein